MTRITATQPASMDEIRVLARGRFGDMVNGVVGLRRGVLLLDADMHADRSGCRLSTPR